MPYFIYLVVFIEENHVAYLRNVQHFVQQNVQQKREQLSENLGGTSGYQRLWTDKLFSLGAGAGALRMQG